MANFVFTAAGGGGGLFTAPAVPSGSPIGTVNFTLTSPPTNQAAPCPIWLDIDSVSGLAIFRDSGTVYEGKDHEYEYVWWLSDGPLDDFTAPVNMLSYWNKANITYGAKASFCLTKIQTYTINVYAVDENGDYAYGSITHTVTDPDTVYSGSNTICLSTASNFAGAPAGSTQVSTLSALNTQIAGTTQETRVLLRYGEEITGQIDVGSGDWVTYVGAFGTESDGKPVLKPTAFSGAACIDWSSNSNNTQITVTDLEFQGPWDPDTDLEYWGSEALNVADATTTDSICINNIVHTGFRRHQTGGNSTEATHKDLCINNSVITNWGDYGLFIGGNQTAKCAILGCRIAQSPDAMQSTVGKVGLNNQHGCVRISGGEWVVIDVCDLFSNDGWGSNGNAQPCIRLGTNQTADDLVGHIGRTVVEGGYQWINGEGENSSATDSPGNYVIDRLLCIGNSRLNQTGISWHKGSFTARNVYGWIPNTPHVLSSNYFNRLLGGSPNNSETGNNTEPFRVYNNAVYSELNSTNTPAPPASPAEDFSPFTNLTNSNNVAYSPSNGTPDTAQGPFDVSTNFSSITPRWKGYKVNYDFPEGNDTVANGNTLVVNYTDLDSTDHLGRGPGTVPNQAYFTANEGTDTKHKISFNNGNQTYYAADGDFTVSYGSSSVTITNTSGTTWSGNWSLQLDRSSNFDSELGVTTSQATPANVPILLPDTGSSALDPGSGTFSIFDWEGVQRPQGSQDAGPFQVS